VNTGASSADWSPGLLFHPVAGTRATAFHLRNRRPRISGSGWRCTFKGRWFCDGGFLAKDGQALSSAKGVDGRDLAGFRVWLFRGCWRRNTGSGCYGLGECGLRREADAKDFLRKEWGSSLSLKSILLQFRGIELADGRDLGGSWRDESFLQRNSENGSDRKFGQNGESQEMLRRHQAHGNAPKGRRTARFQLRQHRSEPAARCAEIRSMRRHRSWAGIRKKTDHGMTRPGFAKLTVI